MLATPAASFTFTAPTALVVDLLRWVATRPRTYRETMEAWRTSCPKLPIWEDARESGFLEVARAGPQDELIVVLTAEGRAFLDHHAPSTVAAATGAG